MILLCDVNEQDGRAGKECRRWAAPLPENTALITSLSCRAKPRIDLRTSTSDLIIQVVMSIIS